MKCIFNGIILLDGKQLEGKALLYNETIQEIIDEEEALDLPQVTERVDARGGYIAPGFVDIHIHGYDGVDTMDGTVEDIQIIAKGIPANGVTSFLPTTMTMSREEITMALDCVRQAKEVQDTMIGADILGVHMEGPFLNVKFKGAQNKKYFQKPDAKYVKDNQDIIRHITVAPEIEGADEFIGDISKNTDISLSMGHTAATFEQAMEAVQSGVNHVTHLFNAMTGLHHREPGVVGAALASDISCELICDNIHVHPGLFKMIHQVKGPDKLILVTDCMRAGGKEDGEYSLGGQKVFVKDNSARLEDGNLAGSVLKLNDALKNMIDYTGIPVEEAIKYVTINPASVINVQDRKGTLDSGKDADITVLDENMEVQITIGKGKVIYAKH
ncbi:MAG: N-acetylglucosamine-6-phosphate deacetylase [Epulopiscium sp.]|nr:N-acetylglucosamine-6-phosphate deacetylase [Candidatus Epulonipiscium sp.]